MSKSRKQKTHSQKVMAKRKARRRKSKVKRPSPKLMIIDNPPAPEKMSEVLEEFTAPYRDLTTSGESLKRLYSVALIAWNATLVTSKAREALISKAMQKLPPDEAIRDDFKGILHVLMQRKLQDFADIKRYILDYQLTDTGNGYHLSVISTLPGQIPG